MGIARAGTTPAKLGASPSGKAADFDSAIRRFDFSISLRRSASFEQVDFRAPIHLAVSRALSLVIWPSVWPLDQCDAMAAPNAVLSFVTPLANDVTRLACARSIQAASSLRLASADHRMERADDVSALRQRGDPAFDRGDGHGLRLREIVAARRHEPRDGSSRGNAAQAVGIGFFRASTPRRPFRNNPQTSSEALALQAPPKFATVSSAGLPLGVEPFEIRLQANSHATGRRPNAGPSAPAHEAPAVARVAHDLLDRRAAFGSREDRGVGFLASQVTLILEPFGGSQQFRD